MDECIVPLLRVCCIQMLTFSATLHIPSEVQRLKNRLWLLFNRNSNGVITCLLLRVCLTQVLMFSATLHTPEVQSLADKITQNPVLADLKGKDAIPETVDHVVVEVDPREVGLLTICSSVWMCMCAWYARV